MAHSKVMKRALANPQGFIWVLTATSIDGSKTRVYYKELDVAKSAMGDDCIQHFDWFFTGTDVLNWKLELELQLIY